jgi:hypothetical protein
MTTADSPRRSRTSFPQASRAWSAPAHSVSHPAITLLGMVESTLPLMIYRPGQTATAGRAGCWTCAYFLGELVAHGAHVVCRRGGQRQVQASPRSGCAFHQREPGTD